MLLRSITKHVKDQNWFAVALDFLIVVVGILIAFQITNWNEDRTDRLEEHALLTRLYAETRELIAVHDEEYSDFKSRGDVLMGVNSVLFSQEVTRPLTIKECEGIAGSHAYRRPSDEIPLLDEMLATGRFDLLRNKALKQRLRDYILFRERARGSHVERTNELFRLYSRHPEQIIITRTPVESDYEGRWTFLSGEGFRWSLNCDVENMRKSAKFLNEYVDNVARTSFVIETFRQRKELLNSLETSLALELGTAALAAQHQTEVD